MNTGKAWTVYIVLRVLFFAVPFALLFWIGWPWWLALVVATLVALALSVIFLSKQRGTASTSIYEWRMRDRTEDDIDEDAVLDSTEVATEGPAEGSTGFPAEGLEAPTGTGTAPANAAETPHERE